MTQTIQFSVTPSDTHFVNVYLGRQRIACAGFNSMLAAIASLDACREYYGGDESKVSEIFRKSTRDDLLAEVLAILR